MEYPGALFHAFSRGNAKQEIFLWDSDRELFLDLLATSIEKFRWIVTSYALMPNHFHLVVELTTETLSRGMEWLLGEYARRFNRQHARVGHLFGARFKAPLVEKESYLLELARYVVLNPVRAGLVERPEQYRWTSHQAVMGQVPAPKWLAMDTLLQQFAPDREQARAAYESFVNAAIGRPSELWKNLVAKAYLGSDEWLRDVRKEVDRKLRSAEHPRAQRLIGAMPMSSIVAVVAKTFCTGEEYVRRRGDGMPRMVAAWIGRNESLLTNSEIAAGLRMRSSGHVSDIVRRCDRELDQNPILCRYVHRCISTLRRNEGEPKTWHPTWSRRRA
ncbi:MAG TPA: transposase [Thermoanaerobaculia bacterium]|nr:transposase [Thermoanaerobaculia bacterium]